jgi:hypothetical protein
VKRLISISVASVFRVSLILGAVAGLLVGLGLFIFDLRNGRMLEGVVTIVLAPILYGLLGAIVNALMAWVYNLVAARFGGIEIELE